MTLGDRKGVWADVFQSGSLWHFSIFRSGSATALYVSRFKDGHAKRSDAVNHCEDLMKEFSRKIIA